MKNHNIKDVKNQAPKRIGWSSNVDFRASESYDIFCVTLLVDCVSKDFD